MTQTIDSEENAEVLLTNVSQEIASELTDSFHALMQEWDIESKTSDEIHEWETGLRTFLAQNNPFDSNRQRLNHAERSFRRQGVSKEWINDDLLGMKELSPEFDDSFWTKKIKELTSKNVEPTKLSEELSVIRRNIQETWRKLYEQKLFNWQLEMIEKKRKEFIGRLSDWLRKLENIKESLDSLGIEPGVLWDTGLGQLSKQDISFLKTWSEYLKKDEKIRELCDLIGRMRSDSRSMIEETVKITRTYDVTVPDISSREEIVGIEFGRNLEDMLPQELSLLSNPDITVLFDLKYVENRLMCFAKRGYATTKEYEEMEEKVSKEDETKGPLIICIDTSGSMAGSPENIAKAVTLALASRAVSQKRSCYLINFSTAIETTDLTPPKSIKDLIDFLKLSFHGGTDVAPALLHGIEMTKGKYEKADILVISDFVLSDVGDDLISEMEICRAKKCKFYALAIGSFINEHGRAIFDTLWTYDPQSNSIRQLNETLFDIEKAL